MTRILPLCLLFLLGACGTDEPPEAPAAPDPTSTIEPMPMRTDDGAPPGSLLAALQDADLDTFRRAIRTSGAADTLSTEGPFTVFAPSDAAFDALPEDLREQLLSDAEALRGVLLAHVLPFRAGSVDLDIEQTVSTLAGPELTIQPSAGAFVVRGSGGPASVLRADLDASNGVVHIIDQLLVSP